MFSKNIRVGFDPPFPEKIYRGSVTVKRGIVAPILEKMNKFKETHLFESLWRRALEAISSADDLWIAGYSLPPADYLSRWLIRTAKRFNSKLTRENIHVILKEESESGKEAMRERYQSVLGSINDFRFDGFESLK